MVTAVTDPISIPIGMESPDELLAPFPRRRRPPVSTEPLWTMQAENYRLEAALLGFVEGDWEVQFRLNGKRAEKWFERREQAIAFSDDVRAERTAWGWTVTT